MEFCTFAPAERIRFESNVSEKNFILDIPPFDFNNINFFTLCAAFVDISFALFISWNF